ncbi:FIVAR domain-containing protein, partial [Enterococcus faecalis]|nr:FIVAR domain-containing protein [Enterococcus faecalis]
YNARPELKQAYDEALKQAEQVMMAKHDQATVNQAAEALTAAKEALDGKVTDKTALAELVNVSVQLVDSADVLYKNATESIKVDFEQNLELAKETLTKEHATQAEVDAVLKRLEGSKNQLDGKAEEKPQNILMAIFGFFKKIIKSFFPIWGRP